MDESFIVSLISPKCSRLLARVKARKGSSELRFLDIQRLIVKLIEELSHKGCYETKIILKKPGEIDQGMDIGGNLTEHIRNGVHPLPLPWHATSRLLIL
jgi:hypothetical protein